ncbi:hypothetical protein C0J52_02647 [Blattella germanica]|nr:hypothetical protein C0J52_02647 [Blattella germanica]
MSVQQIMKLEYETLQPIIQQNPRFRNGHIILLVCVEFPVIMNPDNCDSDRSSLSAENLSFKDGSHMSIFSDTSGNDKYSANRTPTLRGKCGNIVRSNSIAAIKFGNEEKQGNARLTLAKSMGSGEKTPVTHFCTPRRSGSGRHSGKMAADQQQQTPSKRFFGENNVKPPATPECFTKVQMETPRTKAEPEEIPITLGEETSNLTVCVRVRPLNAREKKDVAVTNIVSVDGSEIMVTCDSGTSHTFSYDHCFWSCDPRHPQFASQDVIFSTMVQPLIDKAFQGYNACLFAYGQTGSGKSYSMMGLDVDARGSIGREGGIIPRFCHELFERIASLEDSNVGSANISDSACVEISYFEIYNEKIHDLLGGSSDGGKRPPLKVREHPQFGPYVVDLSVHGVTSYQDLQGWLTVGNSQRATAATGMNEKSSRSHSIFSIILTQTQEETVNEECHKHSRRSKINLVDLAGSERLSQTCASGDRLREGVSINRSLLTLGKVIAALADSGNSKRKGFVPYRDSILTWLLRESLGGNSRTTMLATISPANIHLDETLSTLRYACQARTIVNRVRVNENPHDRLIRELRAEVDRLRNLREDYEQKQLLQASRALQHRDRSETLEQEMENLKEQLRQSEEQLAQAQKSWAQRLKEAELCKSAELNRLRRCGVVVELDWQQKEPCLLNLAADPCLSGTLLYLLPSGCVRVGSPGGVPLPDIVLNGPLVKPSHCSIENSGGKLTLIPAPGAETFVNGEAVKGRTRLGHSDRLVIGGNHYFRVSNPNECTTSGPLADYEFAHQEILRIQEEKLQKELNEAKKKAMQDLEDAKVEAERQMGAQRLNYEMQLQQLEEMLEQHKLALAEVQRKKEHLEIQQHVLEAEFLKRMDRRSEIEETTVVPVYNSNFLQDLEAALNETVTLNVEGTHSTSLHQLSMGVEEANELCKQFGIAYEFQQHHILGHSDVERKVRVRDAAKGLVSYWREESFVSWLQRLRDLEPNESVKELLDSDETWIEEAEEEEDDDEEEQEGSGRRICVSTVQLKKQLNESIQLLSRESCNDSALESSHNTTEDFSANRECMESWLLTLESTTSKMRAACGTQGEVVTRALHSLHNAVLQLRIAFDDPGTPSHRFFPCPGTDAKPGKSNLRSPGPKTNKNVRFFLSSSQQVDSPQ